MICTLILKNNIIDKQLLIDNCSTVDELAVLYIYNDDTPPIRPLGEFPTLEI